MRVTQALPANLRAIGLMRAGVLFLVVNDAIGKMLVERFDPFQILFAGSVVALPFVALLVHFNSGVAGFRSGRLRVHVFRALLAVLATWLFIKSLASLSLAEATSFIFTAPIFVAALYDNALALLAWPLSALDLSGRSSSCSLAQAAFSWPHFLRSGPPS